MLPSSGQLSLYQIAQEFGTPAYELYQLYRAVGYVTANNSGVPYAIADGQIGIGHFFGAMKSVPGSWDSGGSIGNWNVTIPPHVWLRIHVWGGGGGGSNGTGNGDGGNSAVSGGGITTMFAYGGTHGTDGAGGVGGSASGGNEYNLVGGNGSIPTGGASGSGNTGYPGGGGAGYAPYNTGGGGGGGYCQSLYGVVSSSISLAVTAGGGGAGYGAGTAGSTGRVFIEWG
jgi:hypothetical protein